MHDNTLARALSREPGVECLLVPTYTPIRTDEEDVSLQRIFLGGINVYLEQTVPLFRYLPAFMVGWLDRPALIRWAASRAVGTDARKLGAMTVSMLRGSEGRQRKEIAQLVAWLARELKPDLILLSNMLIAGCIPAIRQHLSVPILVTLQGDDIFVESLPEPYRSRALQEIEKLVPHVRGFLVNSRYYTEFMSSYFGIPLDRFRMVPLGVDVKGFPAPGEPRDERDGKRAPPTVGYLARLAPEKGLHVLVDAFLKLRSFADLNHARLHIAGWLGEHQRDYAESQFARLRAAGADWQYAGSVNRAEKIQFLNDLDVLSVPTTYREPKGLYVLEALATGVPVVVPDHGAFPELIESTGGGRLVPAGDIDALAQKLAELLRDDLLRRQLGAPSITCRQSSRISGARTADRLRRPADPRGRFPGGRCDRRRACR
jgi:glycosyltransferase involved in cell wall biosynthesis